MGKNIVPLVSNLLSSDFLVGIMKLAFPKAFKAPSTRGRPRKVSWEGRLKDGILFSKLLMGALSVAALRKRDAITPECSFALMAYTTEHVSGLDIANMFPGSPKWFVREGLLQMGYAERDVPELPWKDVTDVVSEYATLIAEGQYKTQTLDQLKKAGLQPDIASQLVGLPVDQFNAWVQEWARVNRQHAEQQPQEQAAGSK